MPLVFLIVAVLILGLGLVQAWTIWFLKREVQRLEFRLSEALDDEDLLEFQERLRALLTQAKETAAGLAQSVDQRRESLEKSLEKAKQAEKSLALRILSKSAVETSKTALKPSRKTPNKNSSRPADRPVEKLAPKPAAKASAGIVRSGPHSTASRPAAGPKRALEFPAPSALTENRRLLDEDAEPLRGPLPEKRAEGDGRGGLLSRPPAPSRYQKIYDLADQGLDLEQISKQSGVLAGEVDLILNLRRKEAPRA